MRLFVAVWPDDETLERLAQLTLGLERPDGVRLVTAAEWHVTLRFLGEVGEDAVPALAEAIADAARSAQGPVVCELGPASAWFSRGRVLQLPAAGLDALADAVQAATLPVIPERRPERFSGHLTLGRVRGQGGVSAAARKKLAGLAFSCRFDVARVDLVSSETTPQGPHYATVAGSTLEGP